MTGHWFAAVFPSLPEPLDSLVRRKRGRTTVGTFHFVFFFKNPYNLRIAEMASESLQTEGAICFRHHYI